MYVPAFNGSPRKNSTTVKLLQKALDGETAVARSEGDAAAALDAASSRIEAVYEAPYLAHATMEPMNATAHVTASGVEVWAPTQGQGPIQFAVAGLLGLEPGQVKVHTTFLGGGLRSQAITSTVLGNTTGKGRRRR